MTAAVQSTLEESVLTMVWRVKPERKGRMVIAALYTLRKKNAFVFVMLTLTCM